MTAKRDGVQRPTWRSELGLLSHINQLGEEMMYYKFTHANALSWGLASLGKGLFVKPTSQPVKAGGFATVGGRQT